ncbi:hypothetical protein [Brevibacillus dissolubilis]|uniref:hypothetical protein n=1 Tax=Brevibacillus dissolubilis TaxID=1844116 RepID=UPI0011178FC4|nr:hypothetical protein [Brevibacillus dissolubilis]
MVVVVAAADDDPVVFPEDIWTFSAGDVVVFSVGVFFGVSDVIALSIAVVFSPVLLTAFNDASVVFTSPAFPLAQPASNNPKPTEPTNSNVVILFTTDS